MITRPEAQILFSSISAWELVIKQLLGRFVPSGDISNLVRSQIAVNRFEVLPLTLEHALRVASLPDHHRDPFDRALIAQAQVENMPILSADRALSRRSNLVILPELLAGDHHLGNLDRRR